MLVIALEKDERVRIRDEASGLDVWVTLVEVRDSRGRARLGFDADKRVRIMREELLLRAEGDGAAK